MYSELSDLPHLVLCPGSTTGDSAGGAHGRASVESASNGRANVKSERDLAVTDVSREGPGRGKVTDIVITERSVAASKRGDGTDEASRHVVQDPVDGERGREAPGCSRNGVDESLVRMRHS